MSDRHAGYLVTLDRDIREDDAEDIVKAISMVKGVLNVQPVIADPLSAIAENRVRVGLTRKMLDILAKDTPTP